MGAHRYLCAPRKTQALLVGCRSIIQTLAQGAREQGKFQENSSEKHASCFLGSIILVARILLDPFTRRVRLERLYETGD